MSLVIENPKQADLPRRFRLTSIALQANPCLVIEAALGFGGQVRDESLECCGWNSAASSYFHAVQPPVLEQQVEDGSADPQLIRGLFWCEK